MEYILLGFFLFISILTGIIVGLFWLIRARNAYLRKWFIGLIYIFISIAVSSLIIQIIGTFFWIIESENHSFDINKFLKTLYNTIFPWGLMSGFSTLIVFIIGFFLIKIDYLIRYFENNHNK